MSSPEIVVIAEKSSVAKTLIGWLEANGRSVGLPVGKAERKQTYTVLGNVAVTNCVGHVFELKMPEDYNPAFEKWKFSDLPIIPEKFQLKMKASTEAQARAIGFLLKTAKLVIHAGDPDAEGQLLVSEALDFFGYTGPVKRLWLNAMDDTSVANAFASMKPDAEYRGYYESAKARSESDWLVGINFTRAATIVGRKRGATSVLSAGRVQTPTLGLIVRREREIRNFKQSKYFVPWIQLASSPDFKAEWKISKDDDRLDEHGRLSDIKIADQIVSATRAAGTATVKKYSADKKNESAPLPFSLATLQMHMSAKFGMGAQEVLDVAQSLYEKKIASYPRTDCEYLIESQHSEAKGILNSLVGLDSAIDRAISKANPDFRSHAWNSSKATAHHGIIPLRISGGLPSLSPVERKLFCEIVKRYCLQFWPLAQYLAVSIELEAANETFSASGRAYTNKGWRLAFAAEESRDEDEDAAAASSGDAEANLPVLQKGDALTIKQADKKDAATRPPSRYTEGSLIEAMKNAHRFVTNEKLKKVLKDQAGIGTEATRASIINNLKDRGYIKAVKKNVVPTELGEKLFDALPAMLTTVDLTAYWQQEMDDMRQGKGEHTSFVAKQAEMVAKMIPLIAQSVENVTFGEIKKPMEERETKHTCLACGGALRHLNGKYGWFFACKDEACKKLFKDVDGAPVESKKAVESEHKCPACKKSKLFIYDGKNGKYFRCGNEKCGSTLSAMPDGSPQAYHPCPRCKKGNLQSRKGSKGVFWGCSNYKNGCRHTAEDNNSSPAEAANKEGVK